MKTEIQDNKQVQDQDNNSNNLINRVANYKLEEKDNKPNKKEFSFNPQDFDNIDSVDKAKEYAQNAYKSLESGYQTKFQEIAELKKTLEEQIAKSKPKSEWTTSDVDDLIKDPSFLSAAQEIIGKSSVSNDQDDNYSALSDSEKQRISAIEKQNQLLLQQQSMFLQRQQDEQLKSKYPNYDNSAVDTISADLIKGKINNVREYIWKAHDFDSAVKRAYEMGRKDERTGINEQVNASSYEGSNIVRNTETKKEKGESNSDFLKRLYRNALSSRRDQK